MRTDARFSPDDHTTTVKPNILASQRALFDIPAGVTYLNCANMSPQLREVTEVGIRAVQQKSEPWQIRPSDWFAGAEALRSAAAQIMGSGSDGVALVPAVSYGIAIAASNVPLRSGQNIVVLKRQFPSNFYAWNEQAECKGAAVRTVQKAPLDGWTEAVLDSIDDDTAVVVVPNCHWTDGALVDLVQVGAKARSVGAALVVDASQSLGAYAIQIEDVQPDFLVSVGYKWQLGPYGLGFLYVAPKWRESGQPLEASWLTRAGAEDFAGLVEYVGEYRPGARRFDMGEYPQFVLAPMALAALSQLLEWSVENIQATLSRFTDRVATEAGALGLNVLPADQRVGHMIGVRFPDGVPSMLSMRLLEERIYVSVRGDAIRVSPHVFNEEHDAERLLAVFREFC